MSMILRLFACLLLAFAATAQTPRSPRLLFCCDKGNDLFTTAVAAGLPTVRYERPVDAVANARSGDAVLLLERGYPDTKTAIGSAVYAAAREKRIRLFVEYPDAIPGKVVGAVAGTPVERAVVSSDWFGDALAK